MNSCPLFNFAPVAVLICPNLWHPNANFAPTPNLIPIPLPRVGKQVCCLVNYACYKASTTLSLDLCPPASPEFTGPWNEKPRPLMVITLKLHPFHISHLFLNVKWNLPPLNFDFSTLLPSKIGKNCCEMWNRNEACLTTLTMKSGPRSKLKAVLAYNLQLPVNLINRNRFVMKQPMQPNITTKLWIIVRLLKMSL